MINVYQHHHQHHSQHQQLQHNFKYCFLSIIMTCHPPKKYIQRHTMSYISSWNVDVERRRRNTFQRVWQVKDFQGCQQMGNKWGVVCWILSCNHNHNFDGQPVWDKSHPIGNIQFNQYPQFFPPTQTIQHVRPIRNHLELVASETQIMWKLSARVGSLSFLFGFM